MNKTNEIGLTFKSNIIRQILASIINIFFLYTLQYYGFVNMKYFFLWFTILQTIIYYLFNSIFDLLLKKYKRCKNGTINI